MKKGPAHKCHHGNRGRVYSVTQHAFGIIVNKQGKGKTINVHLTHSKSGNSFLKPIKENDQKKKEAKDKGTWVQPKHQLTPPREAYFVTPTGRSLSCWNYSLGIHGISWAWSSAIWHLLGS